jgi:hypothetical protein
MFRNRANKIDVAAREVVAVRSSLETAGRGTVRTEGGHVCYFFNAS